MSENLSQAIQNNDLIKIKQLIEQQDLNELKKEFGQVCFFFLLKFDCFVVVQMNVQYTQGFDKRLPLSRAAELGHLEIVKYLIENGFEVNEGLHQTFNFLFFDF